MTALGAELAASFGRAFMLLADLRRLDPDAHAELVRELLREIKAITTAERSLRDGKPGRKAA